MPRRASFALTGAMIGVISLIFIWFAAFHIGFVHRADGQILGGFEDFQQPRIDSIANFIAHLFNPQPFVYFCAVPVLVAILRRRPRVAVAIAMILFGANLTTQLLKPLLAEPRSTRLLPHAVTPASWPSGHAAAVMSLALCAVLASAPRLRPRVAAAGAACSVAVTFSFLELGWHYPSDVLGGFVIALTWTLIGAAFIFATDGQGHWLGRSENVAGLSIGQAFGPPAALVLSGLAGVGLIALTRPHAVIAYARVHTAFILGAAAIGTLAFTLVTGVMLLSESGRAPTGNDPAPTAALRRRWPRDSG